jgi:hypothetical protein
MVIKVLVLVVVSALAWAGILAYGANGALPHYRAAPTRVCLKQTGLRVSVDRVQLIRSSQGGLVWDVRSTERVIIEFGKSPREALSLRAAVIALAQKFGASKKMSAALVATKANVMWYTNASHPLTKHELTVVSSCLR